jgi:hypothetical protein
MVESMSQLEEESIDEDDAVSFSFSQYSALTNASSVNVFSQLFSVLWTRTLCSKLDATNDLFDTACGKVETVNDSLTITMTESEESRTTVPLQKNQSRNPLSKINGTPSNPQLDLSGHNQAPRIKLFG